MPKWSRLAFLLMLQTLAVTGLLLGSLTLGTAQEQPTRIRISNASLSFTALPLIAAKEWGTFKANGMDAEIIIMASAVAAPALLRGDVDYVGGVGPASVSASLSGLPSRAIWSSSDRIIYWLMAQP
ncbi:MAG: hypothetical protein ACREQV_22625, partial [Candidatus Binatia bacterium]